MGSVSVNPPKTPVTKGSNGIATATMPNVCKMPGPPAPFVPVPLPNIGKSGKNPQDYTQDVTVEGDAVAIKGSTFESMGDVASKGTGGGLISANCEGITKFVGPGSMDVKFEGGNVQFLSDPMLNNCGPGGSPPNSATLAGVIQASGLVTYASGYRCPLCGENHAPLEETTKTEADGDALVAAIMRETPQLNFQKMVGVVHCQHKHKYADHSAVTFREFVVIARDSGYHTRPGVIDTASERPAFGRAGADNVRDRYQRNVPQALQGRFGQMWAAATENYNWYRAMGDRAPEMAYAPGQCAGPKTILLALDSGARPAALTEKWVSSPNRRSTGPNRHVRRFSGGYQHTVTRYFEHGQSVPPCATCALILPLLVCPCDKPTECTGHEPPGGGTHPRPDAPAPPPAPAP
jgi:hypothetical protein